MRKLSVVLLVLLLAGCAVGNKYNYQASRMNLPVKPAENATLVLSVEDLRPYVLDGDKDPSFVGLQRGGYGNPFDVNTVTGNSMTADMAAAISTSLENAGYQVIDAQGEANIDKLVEEASRHSASRIVLLKVRDWKSDIYMSVTLHCDLDLQVFDPVGAMLAENEMIFMEEIGGAQLGADKNSEAMADEFAKRMGYLFNKNEIRSALK